MKKLIIVLLCSLFVSLSVTAAPHNIAEWEKCIENVHVDYMEVGFSGVEAAILKQCGDRPVDESASARGIGASPYDLVRSKTWKQKFVHITKGKYDDFVKRLDLSNDTTSEDGWIVGSGVKPHLTGTDQAAFAINIASGEVFAAILENGDKFTGFGFDSSWKNAPEFLKKWAKERGYVDKDNKQETNTATQKIISRCRTQMGEYGSAMVKACVDQDIEAVIALGSYLKIHKAAVVRCNEQMKEYGYAMIKACVEQDIEAEKALQKY